MEGTVQESDYRTEVQFKDKNLLFLKIKIFTPHAHSRTGSTKLWIRYSDPDSNPDPGLNRWHQSVCGSAARRWIRPGLRYH
jgi:hypothetical protein